MKASEWQARHADKIETAERAVRRVAPGERILIGSGAAEPSTLVEALVSHGHQCADNEIVHLLTLGPAPYVQAGLEQRFRHTAFFIGPNVRAAVHDGRADFMPVFLSEIPELISSRRVRVDTVLIQVSPPDRHGYVSLGVSVDIVRAAVENADLIIAEVNPFMPRTLGQSFLHVSRIASLVPVEYPLPELSAEPNTDVYREIGRNVASLIPDGATIQTGIGRIPHAVVENLRDRRDLGIHTEMLSDSVIDLVEAGVLTGRRKTLLPGKIVTSFVMGSRRLYDWVDENPAVELRPSDFTNDPTVIARNDDMIAINSALAVDLTGQVAADTLMGRFFSGIGGQVDFIRGAARSRRGKPIIALPATAKSGKASRIVAALEAGAGVVTSRGDVHYVVTEYGIADLWGKNIRERAMALIEIAHPDFRADLLSVAKERRYVFSDQRRPRAALLAGKECIQAAVEGGQVMVRPSDLPTLLQSMVSLNRAEADLAEDPYATDGEVAADMGHDGFVVKPVRDDHQTAKSRCDDSRGRARRERRVPRHRLRRRADRPQGSRHGLGHQEVRRHHTHAPRYAHPPSSAGHCVASMTARITRDVEPPANVHTIGDGSPGRPRDVWPTWPARVPSLSLGGCARWGGWRRVWPGSGARDGQARAGAPRREDPSWPRLEVRWQGPCEVLDQYLARPHGSGPDRTSHKWGTEHSGVDRPWEPSHGARGSSARSGSIGSQ